AAARRDDALASTTGRDPRAGLLRIDQERSPRRAPPARRTVGADQPLGRGSGLSAGSGPARLRTRRVGGAGRTGRGRRGPAAPTPRRYGTRRARPARPGRGAVLPPYRRRPAERSGPTARP